MLPFITRRLVSVALCVSASFGCVPSDRAPSAEAVDPFALPVSDAPPVHGSGTFMTPAGPQVLDYIEVDGRRLHQGDILLGPSLEERAEAMPDRHGAVSDDSYLNQLWDGGVVPYIFDPTVGAHLRAKTRAVMDEIEALTPARFVERTDEYYYVEIIFDATLDAGGQSWVGIDLHAIGGQNLYLGDGLVDAGESAQTGWDRDYGWRAITHELLHALGVWHEQSRADRDETLAYDSACVRWGHGSNFWTYPWGHDYGPYDVESVMQYSSWGFCVDDDEDGNCDCLPLTYRGDDCPWGACSDWDGDGHREAVHGGITLSTGDINTLWALYGPAAGTGRGGDLFGHAVGFGDFDGDGYQDLAVGAPGDAGSGYVTLFKGTGAGFEPWGALGQNGMGSNEAGDEFGYALAVGDLDDDGIDDLAVGAPGEAPGGLPSDAGSVFVFHGSRAGLEAAQGIDQEDFGLGTSRRGDRFGSALVIADLDGDGVGDLAVGSPGEERVFVYRGGRNGLSRLAVTWPNGLRPAGGSGNFGSALAAARLDGSRFDLIVGSDEDTGSRGEASGAIYVVRAGVDGLVDRQRLTQVGLGADEAGDAFGRALTVGDLDFDGRDEVIVGAPGEDRDTGSVFVFTPDADGTLAADHAFEQQGNVTPEQGDRFGAALAADRDGTTFDILIGSPGEDWEGGIGAGAAVGVYSQSGSTAVRPWYARSWHEMGVFTPFAFLQVDSGLAGAVDLGRHADGCRVRAHGASGFSATAGAVVVETCQGNLVLLESTRGSLTAD